MKIIFLDVDGVLNDDQTFISRHQHWKETGERIIELDEEKVKLLKTIIDFTGAEIVLSSTWRMGWSHDKTRMDGHAAALDQMLENNGIHIIGKTPRIDRRGDEITEWLMNRNDIDEYVILDDDTFDMLEHDYHIVKTYFYDGGLTGEQVQDAIRILGTK